MNNRKRLIIIIFLLIPFYYTFVELKRMSSEPPKIEDITKEFKKIER